MKFYIIEDHVKVSVELEDSLVAILNQAKIEVAIKMFTLTLAGMMYQGVVSQVGVRVLLDKLEEANVEMLGYLRQIQAGRDKHEIVLEYFSKIHGPDSDSFADFINGLDL